jgi:hypothetical protein
MQQAQHQPEDHLVPLVEVRLNHQHEDQHSHQRQMVGADPLNLLLGGPLSHQYEELLDHRLEVLEVHPHLEALEVHPHLEALEVHLHLEAPEVHPHLEAPEVLLPQLEGQVVRLHQQEAPEVHLHQLAGHQPLEEGLLPLVVQEQHQDEVLLAEAAQELALVGVVLEGHNQPRSLTITR